MSMAAYATFQSTRSQEPPVAFNPAVAKMVAEYQQSNAKPADVAPGYFIITKALNILV